MLTNAPPPTRDELLAHAGRLIGHDPDDVVLLAGSRAVDLHTKASDVDLLVVTDRIPEQSFSEYLPGGLKVDLDVITSGHIVDVVERLEADVSLAIERRSQIYARAGLIDDLRLLYRCHTAAPVQGPDRWQPPEAPLPLGAARYLGYRRIAGGASALGDVVALHHDGLNREALLALRDFLIDQCVGLASLAGDFSPSRKRIFVRLRRLSGVPPTLPDDVEQCVLGEGAPVAMTGAFDDTCALLDRCFDAGALLLTGQPDLPSPSLRLEVLRRLTDLDPARPLSSLRSALIKTRLVVPAAYPVRRLFDVDFDGRGELRRLLALDSP